MPLPLEWAPGETFAVGELRSYDGVPYRCIQAHTADEEWDVDLNEYVSPGWEPPACDSFWEPVADDRRGVSIREALFRPR